MNNVSCFLNINNWIGRLKLCFRLFHGKSVLVKSCHHGPFCIQKIFYPDGKVPHVYLLHPPGGLVSGDQLYLKVYLGVGSHVLLTMTGATKFYRSSGNYVYLKQEFYLEKDSILEWLPQSSIFFSGSKVIIDTKLILEKGARFIFFDTLCFGRLAFRESFNRGILNIFFSIFSEDCIGLKERIRIDNFNKSGLDKLGGYQISAAFFAMPSDIKTLNDIRILIEMNNVKVGGATLLDNILTVRLLDNDNEVIQMLLRNLWCFLRPVIIGKDPIIPRGWLV